MQMAQDTLGGVASQTVLTDQLTNLAKFVDVEISAFSDEDRKNIDEYVAKSGKDDEVAEYRVAGLDLFLFANGVLDKQNVEMIKDNAKAYVEGHS
jgi:hypothetical protein